MGKVNRKEADVHIIKKKERIPDPNISAYRKHIKDKDNLGV